VNREFAGSIGVKYPILSDPSKATARAYGVLGGSGFARRWTFVIGRDGRILAIDKHVSVSSHGRDIAERLAALGVQQRT
jgi:peroxiredoxin Q/BCP